MSDELLPYYEKELAFIRQMGAEFSRENPKIAGRLGINADTIEDPHVSRLIEAFAYLNARTQHKLDDDFPELTDALLNVMFPHYLRPIPSMSIVTFEPDEDQLDSKYTVDRNTELETEYFQGENCRFTTAYPVDMYPLKITSANLIGRPFLTPGAEKMASCAGVLKISLETFNNDINIQEIGLDKLRLYLRGQPQHVHPLYRMLLKECQKIALGGCTDELHPTFMESSHIQAVGFGEDEGLLPYPPNSFLGYRLLTEYFAFAEKFMFIDICNLGEHLPASAQNQLDIYLYLTNSEVELEHNINIDTFVLGATPIINTFKHKCDPIKLNHNHAEYLLLADSRRPKGYEIQAVDEVIASTSSGEKAPFLPFYGIKHEHKDPTEHAYWYATRRPARSGFAERDDGTDVYISLVDLEFNPNIPDDRTLTISAICSNRDLPRKLPFGVDQPRLQCAHSSPPTKAIRCLLRPTATIRPPLRDGARWRLLSHLNLNHLSLIGGSKATEALKEILRLYDFTETSVSRALVDSIMQVNAHAISAPLPINGHTTMCRGVEIEITLDNALLTGSSSYLYASVLEHFFAAYCSVNSFTRVLVKLKNREDYLKKCPPRAGQKVFL
ncbi:type VI secretion protein, VC_A0110 family [Teredinibacter turnerae T7901]|uniref:Type VI secretion protein, VC_A0110 family n=1 Tax=Teredinibacter turnerae (strain ATCC 39867 / T7901) TaxID=377629 RepID=C5BU00_TERTT|nr:type VI secretion system baseplate subunit TssF [Teredinibacter turnerae]ACR11163.1 type VI secretion protein, VC_A0110 family [Teredinibacter turnerae T7901]